MTEENSNMGLHSFIGPSGDEYVFRLLTYGEKMDIMQNKARGTQVRINSKAGFRKPSNSNRGMDAENSGDTEMKLDFALLVEVQRAAVWRTIVKAPWLKEGQSCTKDLADKNINGLDTEAINAFVEKLNWPKGDIKEKLSGQ